MSSLIIDSRELKDFADISYRPSNSLFYTQDFEDLHGAERQEDKVSSDKKCKTVSKKSKKKMRKTSQTEIKNNLSFVSRKRKETGHHLIKINVYELDPGVKCRILDESVCLSAQYVVTDKYDEILDCTESLVSKIVTKISDSDKFKM